ncbi:MAG: hypothetical protein DMF55_06930 [Acidobacteria bacterium]|nr:MAG: hypothetical protein DMF55_06930 [Acidobacteriota bacterium]
MRRSLSSSLALAFLLAGMLGAQTFGQKGNPSALFEHGGAGLSSACMDALGLTDAQKGSIGQIRSDLMTAVQPLFEQRRGFHDQIEAALQVATPDPTAIGRLVIADHGVGEQIRTEHSKFQTRFEALLSPDQLANFKAQRENGACSGPGKRFH